MLCLAGPLLIALRPMDGGGGTDGTTAPRHHGTITVLKFTVLAIDNVKLQRMQNSLYGVICKASYISHVTDSPMF